MTTPAQNKELIQRFYTQVVNQRNVDTMPSFFKSMSSDGTCGGATPLQMVSDPLQPGARLVPPVTARTRGEAGQAPGAETPGPELEARLDFTKHLLAAFPDMLVNIDSILAEGDTVVVHWSARGTHIGEFLGAPATGRVIPFSSTDYFTIEDGKIAGHRGFPDSAQVLAQLGQLPRTAIARVLSGGTDAGDEESPIGRPWPAS